MALSEAEVEKQVDEYRLKWAPFGHDRTSTSSFLTYRYFR